MNRRDIVTAILASATGLTMTKSLSASDEKSIIQSRDDQMPLQVRNVVHPWNPSDSLQVLTDVEVDDGVLVMHWTELQFVDCAS